MTTRARHILALLGTLLIPAFAAWQTGADLPAKIALAAGVVLAALLNAAEIGELKNILAAAGVVAAPIIAGVLGHLTKGSGAAYFVTLIPAILLNLQKALGASSGAVPAKAMAEVTDLPTAKLPQPGPAGKVTVFAVLALGSLLLAGQARAQSLVPSDVAPPLSFCFGASTTCVVPDSGLQAVNYDLVNKKWSGGITGAGVGYALLFAADTAYASGVSIHVTFNFSQEAPSYLAPTFAFVLAHILELGYTPVFFDGRIGQQITLMIGANAEAIMTAYTGKRLGERLAAKRAEQAASAGAK